MDQNKLQIIIEALDKTGKEFADLKKRLKETESGIQSQGSAWKRLTSDAQNFKLKTGEIGAALQSLIGVFLLYKAQSFFKSALDEIEATKNSLRGLGAVARYNGVEIGAAMQEASKLAADGLLDITDVSKALQNLLQRGFSLEEAVAVLNRLKDAAAFNRQASLSMSAAVVSATEGLKNENSILVDNAGVTKNVSLMWKEYAAQIGKSVTDLTQAEKRQAEYNGIMAETEAQVGNAKLATEGLTGAKARLDVEIKKVKRSLGESLTPAFLEITKVINWTLKNGVIPFIAGLEIMAAKSAGFFAKKGWKEEIAALKGAIYLSEKQGDTAKVAQLTAQLRSVEAMLAAGNRNLDEQIAEIMSKWSGVLAPPELGPDTGKRRTETAGTGGDAAEKAAKEKAALAKHFAERYGKEEYEAALEADKQKAKFFADEKKKYLDEMTRFAEQEAENEKYLQDQQMRYLEELPAKQQAIHEGEINRQLAELDMAESLGTAHRQTLNERIRLMEELRVVQEEALDRINKEQDPTGWYAQADAIQATRQALADLAKESAMTRPFAAVQYALTDLNQEWTDTGRQMYEVAKTTAESMQSAFSDFFFDAIHGRFDNLSDYLNSFLDSVARALTNVFAQMAAAGISSGVSGIFHSLSAPSPGSFGPGVGDWAATFSTAHHTGGIVGGGAYRIIPVPDLLPRRHDGGMAPNERLVVNKVGERYITEEQNKWLTAIAESSRNKPTEVYEPHVHLTVNALDSRSVSQALAQHESQIVGILQAAYNRRGKKGPWG